VRHAEGRLALLLGTLGALFALLAAPAAARPTHGLDRGAIDTYVQEQMRKDRVPGVALAVVRGDEIVYLQGYGSDGYGRPVTPGTSFILGSMSKSFTALAVMQLVERGLIALDAPAQRYLPSFRVADPAASAQITVRHLLNHTSGIPARARQAEQEGAALQDHVRALAAVKLSNPPGARHEYASPNYLVLGAIVEQVSGQRYGQYIQQQIFAPLGMEHSFTDQEAAIGRGMARGHRYWFGFPVTATLPYEADRMPTAALISSAGDLARYLLAQLNGGSFQGQRVLSPQSMAEMHRPAAPGDGFSYAMGWRVGAISGIPAIHHGGIVPHFRGKLVLLPEQGWGVAVLTNASTGFPLPIAPTSHRMADAIAASLAGQPLSADGYSQSTAYLAMTIGLLLVPLSQIRGLMRRKVWRARMAGRSPWYALSDVATELVVPALLVLGLPALLGLPWSGIWRASPDLAAWLWLSVALSLVSGAVKAAAVLSIRASHG
jgi:CubicO group peptidase (beta-lactamase class C family)